MLLEMSGIRGPKGTRARSVCLEILAKRVMLDSQDYTGREDARANKAQLAYLEHLDQRALWARRVRQAQRAPLAVMGLTARRANVGRRAARDRKGRPASLEAQELRETAVVLVLPEIWAERVRKEAEGNPVIMVTEAPKAKRETPGQKEPPVLKGQRAARDKSELLVILVRRARQDRKVRPATLGLRAPQEKLASTVTLGIMGTKDHRARKARMEKSAAKGFLAMWVHPAPKEKRARKETWDRKGPLGHRAVPARVVQVVPKVRVVIRGRLENKVRRGRLAQSDWTATEGGRATLGYAEMSARKATKGRAETWAQKATLGRQEIRERRGTPAQVVPVDQSAILGKRGAGAHEDRKASRDAPVYLETLAQKVYPDRPAQKVRQERREKLAPRAATASVVPMAVLEHLATRAPQETRARKDLLVRYSSTFLFKT